MREQVSLIRLFITLLVLIFCAETVIMFSLDILFPRGTSFWVEAITDASLLTAITSVFVWWLFMRPLRFAFLSEAARAKAVMDVAWEAIVTIDERGLVESFNRSAEHMFGYEAREVIGQNVRILMPEPHASEHNGYIERYVRTGEARVIGQLREVQARHGDGTVFPVELNVVEIRVGGERRFTAVMRDITRRKLAEQALLESRAALEERDAKRGALNRVAAAINSSLSLEDTLNEVMREGVQLIGAKASCIAFYDEATQRFVNWVTHGLSEHFVQNMDFRPGGLGDEAFTHGSYVLSNDRPETRHKLSRLVREEGLRSFACLPLTSRARRLGVIYFYRADRDTFTPADIELLSIVASLAAQAIENARLYAQAQEQARTDPLSGLFNRREFQHRLDTEIERARRYGRPLSLLMLDIDHFKAVNDTYGHPAGDEVLRTLAGLIRHVLRPVDQPARYGGEEFAVILPETPVAETCVLAERLRSAIAAAPFALGTGAMLCVTVSIGVAGCPEDADAGSALVAAADRALYAAKSAGRNCVRTSGAGLDADRRRWSNAG